MSKIINTVKKYGKSFSAAAGAIATAIAAWAAVATKFFESFGG